MIGVALIGVALALGGLLSAVAAVLDARRPQPYTNRTPRRSPSRRQSFDPSPVVAAGGCALIAAVVTRWPVAAIAAAALGWWLPNLMRGPRSVRMEARTEAIADWCDLLRDAAATSRGLEGLLAATAPSAPITIRPAVMEMAQRLEFEPIDDALAGLAAQLDHPLGDLLVTALRLSASAGSGRVRQVLDDLATAAHIEASMQRRIDVARQRPRTTMRLVAAVIAAFVAALALFAREYLAPYGTPLGQLVLLVVCGYWALGFWWMRQMGGVERVDRFLIPSEAQQ